MLSHLFCIALYFVAVYPSFEYGEFDLAITEYIQCKGPKRRTCINGTITVLDSSTVKYDFVIVEKLEGIKGKIVGSLDGKKLLRLQIKDVCDNLFLKPLIQSLFRSEQCKLAKGAYLFSVDIQTMARQFYGGKFMYGNWSSKVLFHTDYCNVHCGVIRLLLTPRKYFSEKINNKD